MRPETFLQFVKKARLPVFFTWPLFLWYLLAMAMLIFGGHHSSALDIIVSVIIVSTGYGMLMYWFYRVTFTIYKAGQKAYLELDAHQIEIHENVKIYIKGFDLFSQKKFFPPSIEKTNYDFDAADFILTKNSIVLLGKSSAFGGLSYAYPIEIVITKRLTNMPAASFISRGLDSKRRLEMQIQDDHYSRPVTIVIKDRSHSDYLLNWLVSNSESHQ
ncbi:MAG TPA: hypothetical protein PLI34_03985 [Saprospiraceae bacterium]|nr:hypothetical protein [Saprospiraceae bacterium]